MYKPLQVVGAAIALAIAGCADKKPDEVPHAELRGQASQALIRNAVVKIYPFGQTKSDPEFVTKTDEFGAIVAGDGPQLLSGNYEVVLTGGSYIEEATGTEVNLSPNQYLKGAFIHKTGNPIDIVITPESSIATELAHCFYEFQYQASIENAIIESYIAIGSLTGYNVRDTYVVDLTQEDAVDFSANSPGVLAGMNHAGRSQMMISVNEANGRGGHDLYNSQDLSMLMMDDVRYDCTLDGKTVDAQGRAQPLRLGQYRLSAETYRSELAIGVLEFINSQRNQSALDVTSTLSYAQKVTNNSGSLFLEEPEPIQTNPPVLTTTVLDQQAFSGVHEFTFDASAFVGLNKVEVYIDGVLIDTKGASAQGFTLDSSLYESGEHVVELVAYDNLSQTTSLSRTILIDNDGSTASLTSATLVNNVDYVARGTVDDTYGQTESVVVNGVEADINTDATWEAALTLQEGENTLTIVMTDDLDNVTQQQYQVFVDLTPPQVLLDSSVARFWYDGDIEVGSLEDAGVLDKLYVDLDHSTLGVVSPTADELDVAQIPYYRIAVNDQYASNQDRIDELEFQYRVDLNGIPTTEWLSISPVNGEVIIPVVREYFGDEWLTVDVQDEVQVVIRVKDLAGNTTTIFESFYAYMDMPLVKVASGYPETEIVVREWAEAGDGPLYGECVTGDDGSCVVSVATDSAHFAVIPTGARYLEPYNGTQIETDVSIPTFLAFEEASNDDAVLYPLTGAFVGLLECHLGEQNGDFAAAYTAAEAQVVSEFGFNPTKVKPADLAVSGVVSPAVNHALHNLALSTEVFDKYGQFDSDANSVALAKAIYEDATNCVFDGTRGTNNIAIASPVELSTEFYNRDLPVRLIAVAREEGINDLTSLIERATDKYAHTAPTISISSPGLVNTDTVPVTVHASDDVSLYAIEINGQAFTSFPADDEYDVTLTSEGQQTVTAKAINQVGLFATASTVVNRDTIGPQVSIMVPAYTNATSFPATLSVSDPNGVQSVKVNNKSVPAQSGDIQVDIADGDGTKTVSVVATDMADNEKAISATTVLDTVPPTGQLVPVKAVTNQETVVLAVNSNDANGVGRAIINAVEYDLTGSTGTNVEVPLSGDENVFSGVLYDRAGNQGSLAPVTVVKDLVPPVGALSVSSAVTNDDQVSVTLTASDAHGIAQIKIGNDVYTEGTLTSKTVSVDLVAGSNSITAQVTDVAGNITNVAPVTVIQDDEAPTANLTANATLTNAEKVTITLNSADNDEIASIKIDGVVYNTGDLDQKTVEITLEPGTNTIRATATDRAGNVSATAEIDVIQDVVAPTVSASAPEISYTEYVELSVNASDVNGIQSVTVNGQAYPANASPYSVPLPSYPDSGNNNLEVVVTDNAGNTRTVVATVMLITDLTPPTWSITSSLVANSDSYVLRIEAQDDTGVNEVWIDGVQVANNNGEYAKTVALASPSNDIPVLVRDTVGNEAEAKVATIKKDTHAPTMSLGGSSVEYSNGQINSISSCESTPGNVILSYSQLWGEEEVAFSITVDDQASSDSWAHDDSTLENDYRVLLNGGVKKQWAALNDGPGNNVLVNVDELGAWFASITPDDNIQFQFRTQDPVGNTRVVTRSCNFEFKADGAALSVATDYDWESLQFASIESSLENQLVTDAIVNLSNPTGSPIWVKVNADKGTNTTVTRLGKRRVNEGRWVTEDTWQYWNCNDSGGSCGWATIPDGTYYSATSNPSGYGLSRTAYYGAKKHGDDLAGVPSNTYSKIVVTNGKTYEPYTTYWGDNPPTTVSNGRSYHYNPGVYATASYKDNDDDWDRCLAFGDLFHSNSSVIPNTPYTCRPDLTNSVSLLEWGDVLGTSSGTNYRTRWGLYSEEYWEAKPGFPKNVSEESSFTWGMSAAVDVQGHNQSQTVDGITYRKLMPGETLVVTRQVAIDPTTILEAAVPYQYGEYQYQDEHVDITLGRDISFDWWIDEGESINDILLKPSFVEVAPISDISQVYNR